MGIEVAVALSFASFVKGHLEGQEQQQQSREIAKARKFSEQAKARQANVESQRARVAVAREARIKRAQLLASSGAEGKGSSGIAGASGSIQSQAASNIGFINETEYFSKMSTQANQRIADATQAIGESQARTKQFDAVAGVANKAFGGKASLTSIFNKEGVKKAGEI